MLGPDVIRPFLDHTIDVTDIPQLGEKYAGKVRDVYTRDDLRFLVATDRQSAFDVQWCTIPFKGQVLSQMSAWWFRQIEDIMPTHIVDVPDPNITVAKNLRIIPIEIVVRAYLTGSTRTSVWHHYQEGGRHFCGNPLPDGMRKNQQLPEVILTPSTKSDNDESIDPSVIFERELATQEQWAEISERAFALFARGQQIAAERGLILVDTKYEMGLDENGAIVIADEVHTPDSSRYWVADTYEQRFDAHQEPEALDKEFFRLWLRKQGFEYGQESPPVITDDVRIMLAQRYIDLYERMTGEAFVPAEIPLAERVQQTMAAYL